jgi:hypothetical protein
MTRKIREMYNSSKGWILYVYVVAVRICNQEKCKITAAKLSNEMVSRVKGRRLIDGE